VQIILIGAKFARKLALSDDEHALMLCHEAEHLTNRRTTARSAPVIR